MYADKYQLHGVRINDYSVMKFRDSYTGRLLFKAGYGVLNVYPSKPDYSQNNVDVFYLTGAGSTSGITVETALEYWIV